MQEAHSEKRGKSALCTFRHTDTATSQLADAKQSSKRMCRDTDTKRVKCEPRDAPGRAEQRGRGGGRRMGERDGEPAREGGRREYGGARRGTGEGGSDGKRLQDVSVLRTEDGGSAAGLFHPSCGCGLAGSGTVWAAEERGAAASGAAAGNGI
eukprot:scaffold13281_cov119-Isochrysis_galbana.AAC.10